MSNFFHTDHATPEQVAAATQQVLAKPEVQQAIADYKQSQGGTSNFYGNKFNQGAISKLHNVLKQAGLPSNMSIEAGPDGQPILKDSGGVNWGNIVALGIAAVAGGAALASALSSGGPGAVTSAASGGAGVSEGAAAPAGLGAGAGAAGAGAPAGFAEAPLAAEAIPGGAAGAASGASTILPAGGTGLGAGAASPSILSTAGAYADKAQPILASMAKAGADANAKRDTNSILAQGSKLNQDKFALDAQGNRLGQSEGASILNSLEPSQIHWNGPGSGLKGEVPTYSGGYAGAIEHMDPRVKQEANDVLMKNLQAQLSGSDAATPYLDKVGKTSPSDKLVGGASTILSLFKALRG